MAVFWLIVLMIVVLCVLYATIEEVKDLKAEIKYFQATVDRLNTFEEVNASDIVLKGIEISQLKERISKCEDDYLSELKNLGTEMIRHNNAVAQMKIELRKAIDKSVFDRNEGGKYE